MNKTETYDQTTKQTIFTTTREWIAANGHKVTVISKNSRKDGTILGNLNYTSTTRYICECGKEQYAYFTARKATLDSHDSWMTPAEAEAARQNLMALLNA